MNPESTTELAIVGGGIIGMSIAWRLAGRGVSVRVIDAGPAGHGSSWAAVGILPPPPRIDAVDPIDQMRSYSHERMPDWCRELAAEGGVDAELRHCGGVHVARGRGELATLIAQQAFWQEHGIDWETWPVSRLRNASPHFSHLADGLDRSGPATRIWFLPDEYAIRTSRLIKALHNACRARGVIFNENCSVEAIEPDASGDCRLRTGCGEFAAEQACVAAGAWAQRLLGPLGVQTGVLPVRGQILRYKLPEIPFPMVFNEGQRYLIPRVDGTVLAGSTTEEVGFDCRTTPEVIEQLQAWVEGVMPGWNDRYYVESWAGLRPGSFDGLPYIGRLPHCPQILVAAGHYRSGVHLSIATADIIAAMVCGELPPLDISAFHINRGRTAAAQ